ncbi:hypothetical protein H5410_032465 [Solanum commersonii]|uniref:Uncharacterized protein n=1 Tax=Solanum commersonii TaxID=4109 RepID=A0A9J5YMY5_SOLCO|nr:hypothetical protein H5410_032465 [Solanum commersonii]
MSLHIFNSFKRCCSSLSSSSFVFLNSPSMEGVCSGSNFQLDSKRNLVNCFDVLGSGNKLLPQPLGYIWEMLEKHAPSFLVYTPHNNDILRQYRHSFLSLLDLIGFDQSPEEAGRGWWPWPPVKLGKRVIKVCGG